MIRIMVLSAAMLLVGVSASFAQQDPDDPGIQDSLIIWCPNDHVDSMNSYQFRFGQEIAVTDDSVICYNIPLRWYAPLGGLTCGPGTMYNYPLTQWDECFDTVIASQNYIRQFCFCNSSWNDCLPLDTYGARLHILSLRFIIAPNTPSQLVVFDTCWDDRNGSVLYCIPSGADFIPAVQRGFLSIGSVGVDDYDLIPHSFSLSQNFPNPFNAATSINYSLSKPGPVSLTVYNVNGQRVATLVEGVQEAGEHEVVWEAPNLPSGIYFYRLMALNFEGTKRMIVLR